MTAADILSDLLPAAKLTDPISQVWNWMNEFRVTQLPIIEGGKLYGIVKEHDVLDAESDAAQLRDILYIDEASPYAGGRSFFVLSTQHIYDVISLMSQYRLEILPVTDRDRNYIGVITAHDVVKHLGQLFAVDEEGSTVIVETLQTNYSLGEVGRIVESADAKVLSLYIQPVPDTARIYITLKLNVKNPARVTATFERFGYTVVIYYFQADAMDDYRKNLFSLMGMLD